MPLDAKRLQRVHRVRTLQLGLAQAGEAKARDDMASEQALATRISQLVDAIAPQPGAVSALAAAAHFRERLQRSADAALNRVRTAEAAMDRAGEVTRAARQEQTAVEKLIERARAAATDAEIRALQDLPGTPRKVRHDPC